MLGDMRVLLWSVSYTYLMLWYHGLAIAQRHVDTNVLHGLALQTNVKSLLMMILQTTQPNIYGPFHAWCGTVSAFAPCAESTTEGHRFSARNTVVPSSLKAAIHQP